MAQKSAKIDDVKRPEKVTPSATSRPILVSSQTSAPADPMMVPSSGDKSEGETVQVMSHTAKTITPPSELAAEKAKEEPKQPSDSTTSDETTSNSASIVVTENSAEIKAEKAQESTPDPPEESEPTDKVNSVGEERDPDAALSAEESAAAEARAKREEELENLITSGKYAVPINAVQRRRSRLHTIILSVVAVLLAVALIDLVADAGIIDLPSSVPHTHFFSGH